jgi:hypothetical protein
MDFLVIRTKVQPGIRGMETVLSIKPKYQQGLEA